MVSEEKIFLIFAHYKSMEILEPQGKASLKPTDVIDRIYVGDH